MGSHCSRGGAKQAQASWLRRAGQTAKGNSGLGSQEEKKEGGRWEGTGGLPVPVWMEENCPRCLKPFKDFPLLWGQAEVLTRTSKEGPCALPAPPASCWHPGGGGYPH